MEIKKIVLLHQALLVTCEGYGLESLQLEYMYSIPILLTMCENNIKDDDDDDDDDKVLIWRTQLK